jgi:membrane-associated HD superfamily phosphohydrolase
MEHAMQKEKRVVIMIIKKKSVKVKKTVFSLMGLYYQVLLTNFLFFILLYYIIFYFIFILFCFILLCFSGCFYNDGNNKCYRKRTSDCHELDGISASVCSSDDSRRNGVSNSMDGCIYLFIYLFIYLSVCLSVCLFMLI